MKNEISTIQIRNNVKSSLDKLKIKSNESYEDVIVRILEEKRRNKKEQEALLIEGCKVMAEESLRITKELEAIEDLDSWEW